MEAKEEVRARLNIEDVVGEYIQLKRAGRTFKGLSPFSGEKTPSFFVSPEKQIWHDFSSNKGGDIFSFIMEVEGLDFRGALELLARKAGVDLSIYQRGDGSLSKKKDRLHLILDLAAKYYQQLMIKTPEALEYIVKKRGLNKQTVQDFFVGYASSTPAALTTLLRGRGFSQQELNEAGLVGSTGKDLFRSRMMIALQDPQGRVVGFTGRLIEDIKNAPKYLNTPQTILFDKGRHVFGLHLAKEAIRTEDFVVIVEGNVDVMSSHQAGVRQVVATAGTALTEQHLRTLARFTQHIRLCFDADKAGLAASERAIGIADSVGVELMMVVLPEGSKDPDELIQKDLAAWEKAIREPQDAVEWIIEHYMRQVDSTTPEGKKKVSDKALQLIQKQSDEVKRSAYIQLLAKKLQLGEQGFAQRLARLEAASDKNDQPLKETKADAVGPDPYAYQDHFLALNVAFGDVRDSLAKVDVHLLDGIERQKVFTWLIEHPEAAITNDALEDLQDLKEYATYVKILLFKAEERYQASQWTSVSRYHEAIELAHRIIKGKNLQTLKDLTDAMREAHEKGDDAREQELMQQFQAIKRKG